MNQAAQQNPQGNAPGNVQSNQQQNRRYEGNSDQQEQGDDYDQDVPGAGDQPMAESRPIAINAGSPEGE